MTIHKVKADFSFQGFFPFDPAIKSSGDDLIRSDIAMGRGVRKLHSWTPLPIFVDKPECDRGNFVHVWGLEDFAVDNEVCHALGDIFVKTCELLPFQPYEGKQYYRLNILNSVDCLDYENTKWRIGPDGRPSAEIEEFHFNPALVGQFSLFKLPKRSGLLTISGLRNGEPEFKSVVERCGFAGVKFEEIWSKTDWRA